MTKACHNSITTCDTVGRINFEDKNFEDFADTY